MSCDVKQTLKQARHNKSGKEFLAISDFNAEKWQTIRQVLKESKRSIIKTGHCLTPCERVGDKKGRISKGGVKLTFGYHIIAWDKYGEERISKMVASKKGDSEMISHLCGTEGCIVPQHIIVETKRINDERTMCHFCMNNIRSKNGVASVTQAMDLGLCPHKPPCGSLDMSNTTSTLDDCLNKSVKRQKVRDENSLYNLKLQETPGKSLTTANEKANFHCSSYKKL